MQDLLIRRLAISLFTLLLLGGISPRHTFAQHVPRGGPSIPDLPKPGPDPGDDEIKHYSLRAPLAIVAEVAGPTTFQGTPVRVEITPSSYVEEITVTYYTSPGGTINDAGYFSTPRSGQPGVEMNETVNVQFPANSEVKNLYIHARGVVRGLYDKKISSLELLPLGHSVWNPPIVDLNISNVEDSGHKVVFVE